MEFNLFKAQKKGMASAKNTVDWLIGGLIAVVLIGALGGTIFGYLGSSGTGLGNSTANPAVPTWLPTVMIIIVAVGFVYLLLKATGVSK